MIFLDPGRDPQRAGYQIIQSIISIGSGGAYAQAAARALLENTDLDARAVVEKGLMIAADICVYTNQNLTIEELNTQVT